MSVNRRLAERSTTDRPRSIDAFLLFLFFLFSRSPPTESLVPVLQLLFLSRIPAWQFYGLNEGRRIKFEGQTVRWYSPMSLPREKCEFRFHLAYRIKV